MKTQELTMMSKNFSLTSQFSQKKVQFASNYLPTKSIKVKVSNAKKNIIRPPLIQGRMRENHATVKFIKSVIVDENRKY